jgi:hypothetical protein
MLACKLFMQCEGSKTCTICFIVNHFVMFIKATTKKSR